jgi:hypothetical protein
MLCYDMHGSQTTDIKQIPYSDVIVDYFYNNFLKEFASCGH